MASQLNPGQSLYHEQELRSPNNKARLVMQADGNLVAYRTDNGSAYWQSDTQGSGATEAVMQTDGNFVLYDTLGHAHWNTYTQGQKGAYLDVQDDGNIVVYVGTGNAKHDVWRSVTAGFRDTVHGSGSLLDWAGNVMKTAARAVGSAVHIVDQAYGTISDLYKKIPILGPLYTAEFDYAYGFVFKAADDIGQGKALDQVAMNAFRNKMADVHEIAPYAETVIALVPGVGPEVSAAIGCGLALAEGKSIDQALLAGVRASIPGGGLAQAAFDVGHAAFSGKSASEIALASVAGIGEAAGVQIPYEAQEVLSAGLHVGQAIAKGEPVSSAIVDQAISYLPPDERPLAQAVRDVAGGKNVGDVLMEQGQKMIPTITAYAQDTMRKGFAIGMTMGQAQRLQGIIQDGVQTDFIKYVSKGEGILAKDPTVRAGMNLVQTGQNGYKIGIGFMTYAQKGSYGILAVRNALSPDDKRGFDSAVSLHAGRVTTPEPPPTGPVYSSITQAVIAQAMVTAAEAAEQAKAAYFMTHGMRLSAPKAKANIMVVISDNPAARTGAVVAAKKIALARSPWWRRLLVFIHLQKA